VRVKAAARAARPVKFLLVMTVYSSVGRDVRGARDTHIPRRAAWSG
jgi:hypothetical protein